MRGLSWRAVLLAFPVFSIVYLLAGGALWAQSFYNYVGQIESQSVLLAWGVTAAEGNTIGRGSTPLGHATVKIAGRAVPSERNWAVIDGLKADTEYPYEIEISGRKRGEGQVRTWAENANHFCFFVIGDFGNGTTGQYRVADAMWQEFQRRATTNCPVRFVLTVGDNIYADASFAGLAMVRSGDLDAHWEAKFFRPYAPLIRQIPFMPTLGNHDGNKSENRADLFAYLDNFFFPGNRPARWYTFTYGGLAQFFAMDTTDCSESGPPRPAYSPGGEQNRWLEDFLRRSRATWKIPYFHHPVYNAGPRHGSSYQDLKHFVDLFEKTGVKVVFAGHEHNFQFTRASETGGICYVISGSGGELRAGDIRRKMNSAHIAGWAAVREFLSVEIQGTTMRVMPISGDEMKVIDADKHSLPLPLQISLNGGGGGS